MNTWKKLTSLNLRVVLWYLTMVGCSLVIVYLTITSPSGHVRSATPQRSHSGHLGSTTAQRSYSGHLGSTTPQRSHSGHLGSTTAQRSHSGHLGSTTPQRSHSGHLGSTTPQRSHSGYLGPTPAQRSYSGHLGSTTAQRKFTTTRRAFTEKTQNSSCNCSRILDDRDYDGDRLDSLAQNSTASPPDSGSHLLSPAAANNTNNTSILSSLWSFENINDEVLFLYEQILNRNISANYTNIEMFRQELAAHRTELKDSSAIILHQKNCEVRASSKKLIKTSAELYRLLPKSDPFGLPQKKRYPSCAIVGNSGSILHSGCGGRIDEHDFVIRCNLAPLAPFKEDAGMRSDYNTMNPSIYFKKYGALKKDASIKQYNQDMSQYGGMLSIPCFGMSHSNDARAIRSFKGKKPTIVCMNGKHFSSVRDFWKKKGVIDRNPSTGFYLVSMAIQLCDEIDLYGFWPFSSRLGNNKTNVPYHYFDDMSNEKAGMHHRMNKEFSTLLQLHVLGILNLNVGSCS